MQKRIMMLGGNHVQMTATRAAKEQGYYVISVDYLPDNPAHKIADEYHNVSTIDKKGVLDLARRLKIDGIVSYASDVSAPTAAYVAEQLGLPTNPLQSVEILTHKNLFRKFMHDNGLPMPKGDTFDNLDESLRFFESVGGAVMIKPIDSSGSKGVFKCYTKEDVIRHWDESLSYSISKKIIVEEFIDRQGYQIDGDIFMENGEIVFWGICDQHHDELLAPYVPVGLSYPSVQDMEIQKAARRQLKIIFRLLGMKMGAYNIEYIVDKDHKVYILEIGPRNGGNWIPDVIKEATGFDMAANTVRQAVGDTLQRRSIGYEIKPTTSYLIHAQENGMLSDIIVSDTLKPHIVKTMMFTSKGNAVKRFHNSGDAIGIMLISFDTIEELNGIIDDMNSCIDVRTTLNSNILPPPILVCCNCVGCKAKINQRYSHLNTIAA